MGIKNILKVFVITNFGFFFLSCSSSNEKIHLIGEAQGTYYSIIYFDDSERNLKFQIDSILDAFDQSVSIYKPQSIVSKVNRNEDVLLNNWFLNNFYEAIRIAKLTDGAMDITIGPLANAWGFGTFDQPEIIDSVLIDSVKQLVNFRAVSIQDRRLIKQDPRIQLNFNAIAQGNSVDVVGDYFISLGIDNFLIDIGGELLGKGEKPNGEKWIVGIEKPSESSDDERVLQQTFALQNNALATSGNYRKYYEIDGVRYAHSLDPKTGFPVEHSLLSVSVLTKTCTEADAFATAFMVMGIEKSLRYIEQHAEIQAYFIYFDKEYGIQTQMSDGFMKALELE
ncbi:MAG: FAD:protein FMN transferase [Bacteroidales bacterium]|jgi:thiamine biosynthesis lipoprotein|nr:FAD:protein FMN transferase [Bacteroidales bacterium]